jgi:hypothetical protein
MGMGRAGGVGGIEEKVVLVDDGSVINGEIIRACGYDGKGDEETNSENVYGTPKRPPARHGCCPRVKDEGARGGYDNNAAQLVLNNRSEQCQPRAALPVFPNAPVAQRL